ncbi:MAG: prenyltransferase [Candidatus Poribacteria bacterium]|nr:MAG: prenyltransferase [Candidatus Poribacteria bacterium]
MRLFQKAGAFLALSRPANALIAMFGVISGSVLALKAVGRAVVPDDLLRTAAGAVATAAVLAAGNALNDLRDLEIDRINRPERPLPSGRLRPVEAGLFAAVMGLIGIALAALVDLAAGGLAVGAVLLLILYAWRLKGTPLWGNLLVALLSAGAYLAGGIAVRAPGKAGAPALFIFFFSLVRELLKDVEDVAGDRIGGARTAAVVWGERRAVSIAAAVGALGILFTIVPFLLQWRGFGVRYLIAVVLGVDLIVAVALFQTVRRPEPAVAGSAQRWLKRSMILGLIAILVG